MRLPLLLAFAWLIPLPLPAADQILDTAVKLKTAKRSKDNRQEGNPDEVLLRVWIPDGVKVVRGAVFNPFNLKTPEQAHWQAACRHWGFALIGSNHFGVDRGELGPSLLRGLKQFAEQGKRPEIAHLPLCLVGMSAGGGQAVEFTAQLPERVIACAPVCLEVGPRNEASHRVPTLTVFGEKDGRQMRQLAELLPKLRAAGAQYATAVQWKRRHEFARANDLILPWFDHVIRARYPADASPVNGPVKFRDYPAKDGWLGDPSTWGGPVAAIAPAKGADEPSRACWLPGAYVAHVWQAFVIPSPAVHLTLPTGLGDGRPFTPHPAGKPLAVRAAVEQGVAVRRLDLYDGDRPVAAFDGQGATVELPPGIHALIAVATLEDGTRRVSRPNTILVTERGD